MATAEAFLAALDRASVTQDTSTVRALTTSDCSCLADLRTVIDGQKSDGVRVESDPFPPMFSSIQSRSSSAANVLVHYVSPPGRVVDKSGKVVEKLAGGPHVVTIRMVFDRNRWRVATLEPTK